MNVLIEKSALRNEIWQETLNIICDVISTYYRYEISQTYHTHTDTTNDTEYEIPMVEIKVLNQALPSLPRKRTRRETSKNKAIKHAGNSVQNECGGHSETHILGKWRLSFDNLCDPETNTLKELAAFLQKAAAAAPGRAQTESPKARRRSRETEDQIPLIGALESVLIGSASSEDRVVVISDLPSSEDMEKFLDWCETKRFHLQWMTPETQSRTQEVIDSGHVISFEELRKKGYRNWWENETCDSVDNRECVMLKVADPDFVVSSAENSEVCLLGDSKFLPRKNTSAAIRRVISLSNVSSMILENVKTGTDILTVDGESTLPCNSFLVSEPTLWLIETSDEILYGLLPLNRFEFLGLRFGRHICDTETGREDSNEHALTVLAKLLAIVGKLGASSEEHKVKTDNSSSSLGTGKLAGKQKITLKRIFNPFCNPHSEGEDNVQSHFADYLPNSVRDALEKLYISYVSYVLGQSVDETPAIPITASGTADPIDFILHSIPTILMEIDKLLTSENLPDDTHRSLRQDFQTPWLPFELLLVNTEVEASMISWKILNYYVSEIFILSSKQLTDCYTADQPGPFRVNELFPAFDGEIAVHMREIRAREMYLQLLLRLLVKCWNGTTICAGTSSLPLICLRPRSRLKTPFHDDTMCREPTESVRPLQIVAPEPDLRAVMPIAQLWRKVHIELTGRITLLLNSFPPSYSNVLPPEFDYAESFLSNTVVRVFGKRLPFLLLDLLSTIEMDVPSRLVAIEHCEASSFQWKPCRSKEAFQNRIEVPLETWQLACEHHSASASETRNSQPSSRHYERQQRQRKRYYRKMVKGSSESVQDSPDLAAGGTSVNDSSVVNSIADATQNTQKTAHSLQRGKKEKEDRTSSKRRKLNRQKSNERLYKVAEHLKKDEKAGYFTSFLGSSHFSRPARAKVAKHRKRKRTSKRSQDKASKENRKEIQSKSTNGETLQPSCRETSTTTAASTPQRRAGTEEKAQTTPIAQMSLHRKLVQETPDLVRQQKEETHARFETPMAPPPSVQRRRIVPTSDHGAFSPLRSIANLDMSQQQQKSQRQLQFNFDEE